MAKGTDHIFLGMCVGMLGIYLLRSYSSSLLENIVWLAVCVGGSLFPDIDVASKGQKLFYFVLAPLYLFLFARKQCILCVLVGLIALIPLLCSHRGLFHRCWFNMLFACLWATAFVHLFPFYVNQIIIGTLFFIAGALSHLWLDFGLKKMIFR